MTRTLSPGRRNPRTEAKVGKLAQNLLSAAEFLKAQQKIDAVPDLATVEKAIYVKGKLVNIVV